VSRQACGDGSSWEGGQSSAELVPSGGRSLDELCLREKASSMDSRAKDQMDLVVVDKCLSTLGIGDEHKFHWSFHRGEDMCGHV
jgi:hypothetical protein